MEILSESSVSATSDAKSQWTIDDAISLYRMDEWSDGYFSANEMGNVVVRPERDSGPGIDVSVIVKNAIKQGVDLPLLIRFQDVLRSRVIQLNMAFRNAIESFEYSNRYVGVYPIKVNQLHEVVEEVLEAGQPYGIGLECGSKAELVAALPHLERDDTLLICNGYKDQEMLGLILTMQQLGKAVVPVVEKYDEFERLISRGAEMDIPVRFGVRVRLSTNGMGRWAASSGDSSKFGVTISELLKIVEHVRSSDASESLQLLHFHLGSQISDIQTLKLAVKEITNIYVELCQKGLSISYLDVGGGLGVNYESSFSGRDDSINYTLTEYANSVVYAVKEVCDAKNVKAPVIVSESGRAITAHHSVLIVNVLEAYKKEMVDVTYRPNDSDHLILRELFETLTLVQASELDTMPVRALLEAYHDAVEKRQQSHSLFSLGYLPLEQKAVTESLFWSICNTIYERIKHLDSEHIPAELSDLETALVDQYLCDFSVFQSILDHWAIGQRFPIVPLQRLNEEPMRRAVLVDLTCDSDGKVQGYVSPRDEKDFLEVHEKYPDKAYNLCFFLMGAYQDIMGDMHNLFGRVSEVHVYADSTEPAGYYIEKIIPGATIREMLALVQYFPNDLHRRMKSIIREKVESGMIRPKTGVDFLDRYDEVFMRTTYLKPTATDD
jgi:arginine decarboxylase